VIAGELVKEAVLITEQESIKTADLKLSVWHGYPFMEEGDLLSFESEFKENLIAADKTGREYAEKSGLKFRQLPRLSQTAFEEKREGLELMKPKIELIFHNQVLRERELEAIKVEDGYTVRQVDLSEVQKQEIMDEHGRKVALGLLLRGRLRGEESRYHDVMFLIYEDELAEEAAVARQWMEVNFRERLREGDGFWMIEGNNLKAIDEVLRVSGARLREEDKLSVQIEGLYKKRDGLYKEKILLTDRDYELFYVRGGELVMGMTVFNKSKEFGFKYYEQRKRGLVEGMRRAQASEAGVHFFEPERFTIGNGGLSGPTTNEAEDILEQTAVDKDGNVQTAFEMAPPDEMFSEDQLPEVVDRLRNRIMGEIGELNESWSAKPEEWAMVFSGFSLGGLILAGAVENIREIEVSPGLVRSWPMVETTTVENLGPEGGSDVSGLMTEGDWVKPVGVAGEMTKVYLSEPEEWWAIDVVEDSWDEEIDWSDDGGDGEGPRLPEVPKPGGGLVFKPELVEQENEREVSISEMKAERVDSKSSGKNLEIKEVVAIVEGEEVKRELVLKEREEKDVSLKGSGVDWQAESLGEEKIIYQSQMIEQESVNGEGLKEDEEVPRLDWIWEPMGETDVPMLSMEEMEWSMTMPMLNVVEGGVEGGEEAFEERNWSRFEFLVEFSEVATAILLAMVNTFWEQPRVMVPVMSEAEMMKRGSGWRQAAMARSIS